MFCKGSYGHGQAVDWGKGRGASARDLMPATSDSPLYQMKFGVVCLMDALGFKGIWRDQQPGAVVGVLEAIRLELKRWFASMNELQRELPQSEEWEGLGTSDFHGLFVSDTVILAATCDLPIVELDRTPNQRVLARELVLGVMQASARVSWIANQRSPSLAFRGCVATGRLLAQDPFIIGEAVDEAAESMEKADAAIVWLTPSARRTFDGSHERDSHDRLFAVEATIPLVGGQLLRTVAINPLHPDHRSKCEAGILSSFDRSSSLDVAVKRQNTEHFLRTVKDQLSRFEDDQARLRARTGGDGRQWRPVPPLSLLEGEQFEEVLGTSGKEDSNPEPGPGNPEE